MYFSRVRLELQHLKLPFNSQLGLWAGELSFQQITWFSREKLSWRHRSCCSALALSFDPKLFWSAYHSVSFSNDSLWIMNLIRASRIKCSFQQPHWNFNSQAVLSTVELDFNCQVCLSTVNVEFRLARQKCSLALNSKFQQSAWTVHHPTCFSIVAQDFQQQRLWFEIQVCVSYM